MPEICTSSVSPNNCGHRQLTVGGLTWHADLNRGPLTDDEKRDVIEKLIVWKGLDVLALVGRVIVGDEATNVKAYQFFGPGAAITKTNINQSSPGVYVNVCGGANGERKPVDLTGCTKYRIVMHANLAGSGPYSLRMVRDSDNLVLHESTGIAAGERELDTDAQDLPQAFHNAGIVRLRVQALSATGADDPVFRGCTLYCW